LPFKAEKRAKIRHLLSVEKQPCDSTYNLLLPIHKFCVRRQLTG
jgi:hypothetical protein